MEKNVKTLHSLTKFQSSSNSSQVDDTSCGTLYIL